MGSAIGDSIASGDNYSRWGSDDTETQRLSARYPAQVNGGGIGGSAYTGGDAWAADVAARRASSNVRQVDELLAAVRCVSR